VARARRASGAAGVEQTLAGDGETKGEERRERPGGTVGKWFELEV